MQGQRGGRGEPFYYDSEGLGEAVEVLVESTDDEVVGRAAHQGPEVDGTTTLVGGDGFEVGDLVVATVVASEGVDLVAQAVRRTVRR